MSLDESVTYVPGRSTPRAEQLTRCASDKANDARAKREREQLPAELNVLPHASAFEATPIDGMERREEKCTKNADSEAERRTSRPRDESDKQRWCYSNEGMHGAGTQCVPMRHLRFGARDGEERKMQYRELKQ
jgi:hypothetical protein